MNTYNAVTKDGALATEENVTLFPVVGEFIVGRLKSQVDRQLVVFTQLGKWVIKWCFSNGFDLLLFPFSFSVLEIDFAELTLEDYRHRGLWEGLSCSG